MGKKSVVREGFTGKMNKGWEEVREQAMWASGEGYPDRGTSTKVP